MQNIDDHLLSLEESVGNEFACAQGDWGIIGSLEKKLSDTKRHPKHTMQSIRK
jgi:hypothetical protein